MYVKLIPPADSELEEITIRDQVFPIGRYHTPFRSYNPVIVRRLSRRHARIFKENGQLFLIDTGSRNGTSLNGVKLTTQPLVLANGDRIRFSEQLHYTVALQENQAGIDESTQADPEICLTLTPEDATLEPIVISRYPFLVSKADHVFAKFADRYPHDVRYISRKHAYFSVKGNQVYLEDLESTNGTFLNGSPLSEVPAALNNGDRVGFGGKRFVYIIRIETKLAVADKKSETSGDSTHLATGRPQNEPKTTFVSSATSFLDIFCAQEDEAEKSPADEINPEINHTEIRTKAAPSWLSRFFQQQQGLLQNAFTALGQGTLNKAKKRGIHLGLVVLILAIGTLLALYWKDASKRDIQILLQTRNYERSLELANRYLQRHPEDEEIRELATQAMLKLRIPKWVRLIQAGHYETAHKSLTEIKNRNGPHNWQTAKLAELLFWSADLDRFVRLRGDPKAPLDIFQQGDTIEKLLAWWQINEESHRKRLRMIANAVAEFKPIRSRIVSDLRTLQNEQSVYLDAIRQLKTDIRDKLENSRSVELGNLLEKFAQKYPRVQGLNQVRNDWRRYQALEQAIAQNNLRAVMYIQSKDPLKTPFFRSIFEQTLAAQLPAPRFQKMYTDASEAWRSGKIDEALALLNRPGDKAWKKFANPELERKKNLSERFIDLGPAQGTRQYGTELMQFYSLLDQDEDLYFLEAVRSEVLHHRESVSAEARKEMGSAGRLWKDYATNGRINGFLRLQSTISGTFKKQCERLSEAYSHAQRGILFFRAAGIQPPVQSNKLYSKILRETKLQRNNLKELEMVLEPATIRAKLELIVEPSDLATIETGKP